jgi:hypothetical protein
MTKKKASPAQLAARKKFVEMVRAKAKAKKSATKKVTVKKVSGLDKVVRKGKKTDVKYSRISGISKTITGLTKNYLALYQTKYDVIVREIKSTSLIEAKRIAQFHKRHNTELNKTTVTVKLKK